MKLGFPPRYFLASTALLLVLVASYGAWSAHHTRRDLLRQLEENGVALADTLETSNRNAIRGNALVENMIAERLLDNARLVDELVQARGAEAAVLERVRAMNRLRRIDLLDRDGRPYVPPATAHQPPDPSSDDAGMRGMMGPMGRGQGGPGHRFAERHREMMMYMWGRRWSAPSAEAEGAPPVVKDRRFWEGSVFGVAVGARSFPGIIAVHADADYVLNFRKEIGVERQIEELGRQSGVAYVALLDRDLHVLAQSPGASTSTAVATDAARTAASDGRTVTRLVRDASGAEVFDVLKPVTIEGGAPALLRIGLSTASMNAVWRRDRNAAVLLGLAVLLAGTAGLGLIFYVQHRHLAEMQVLQATMAQRERLAGLGNMAAAVAHEIRNPLNAVSMGLQRLGAEFRPDEVEEYDRLVGLMHGEVRRLNGIVEEFLSLARPLSLALAPVDVEELLRELAGLVEAEAKAQGVEVTVDVVPSLPPLRADRDRLVQALLNLALNGIQAMAGGGRLTLAAAAAGPALHLTVADTGPGIAPDLLARIFEPYVTTRAKGLGLGLPIARRIVEAHGGRVEAESAPGRGTRFDVTLPLRPR